MSLVSLRTDVVFRLYLASEDWETSSGRAFLASPPVATSNVVTFRRPWEPLQTRLAVTPDPTEMRVMWSGSKAAGYVKYGVASGRSPSPAATAVAVVTATGIEG